MIPTIDVSATGKNISRLMSDAGMTVNEFQKAVGVVSIQAVYKWLNGKTLPTVDNLVIIADIFGVTIDDLIVKNN